MSTTVLVRLRQAGKGAAWLVGILSALGLIGEFAVWLASQEFLTNAQARSDAVALEQRLAASVRVEVDAVRAETAVREARVDGRLKALEERLAATDRSNESAHGELKTMQQKVLDILLAGRHP